MLSEIRIRELGVISEAVLELDPGFTVITGETGAGKTMVVTGLHLLGGGRADASRVRTGARRAVVEGWFTAPDGGDASTVVADAGAELDEDGSLICARTVGADGRSRAHLGGRSVPATVLTELSAQLLAVHGQNDQLRLLRAGSQRAMLDGYGGERLTAALADYRRLRQRWCAARDELARRRERSRELTREADLLRHGLDEIAAAEPRPSEDTDLVATARRLADVDELRTVAEGCLLALGGSADSVAGESAVGAVGLVAAARKQLAATDDPTLSGLEPRLAEAAVLLGDVAAELGEYLDELHADPEQLERVLARQAELKALTRKYAADVDGVLAWAEDARARLAGMDTSDEALSALAQSVDGLAGELGDRAKEVTALRTSAARRLASEVTGELAALAMPHAELEVAVTARQVGDTDHDVLRVGRRTLHAGVDGTDEVEFRLRPHRGAQPMPVAKAASGGELSRVMLALEVVLASSDPVPTMVFDEVDSGVGGKAAVQIGRRLAGLARHHQVLVVTHLPQVAAYADRHVVVDKTDDGTVTESALRRLSDGERVVEVARMLAGMDSTDSARAHAQELLSAAESDKAGGASAADDHGSRAKKAKRKNSAGRSRG